jgi:hypothetical protein
VSQGNTGLGIPFDPTQAINLSVPPPSPPPARYGWYGPFPSRPCDNCGHGEFRPLDWGMGYRCLNCGTRFGTDEEWRY